MIISHRKNSLLGFVSFGIPTIVILGAYPVLINFLGVDAMGAYLLSTSLSGAWAILDMGMFAATLKYVSEDQERRDHKSSSDVIRTSLSFYLVVGSIFTVLIWLLSSMLVDILSISESLKSDAIIAFKIAGIRFSIFSVLLVYISIFKALHRFDYSAYMLSGLSLLTFGGAAGGAAFADLGLVGISVVALVANLLVVAGSAYLGHKLMLQNEIVFSSGTTNVKTFRRMLNYGVFSALNGIATSSLVLVQKFIISMYLGPAAVTVFTLAATVISKVQAGMLAATEFIVPWASKLGASNDLEKEVKITKLYIKATLLVIVAIITGAIILFYGGEIIVYWWIRSPLSVQVNEVLQVLLIGLVAWSLVPTGRHLFNGIGKPHVNTIFLVVYASTMYIALFILLADGASIRDFAISQSFAMVVQAVLFIGFLGLFVWKRLKKEKQRIV